MPDIQDRIINELSQLEGVEINGNRVVIKPRATGRGLHLRANKNGKGYITSYTLPIGCAEAVDAGFVDSEKQPLELEKIIDSTNHTITFCLKQS